MGTHYGKNHHGEIDRSNRVEPPGTWAKVNFGHGRYQHSGSVET